MSVAEIVVEEEEREEGRFVFEAPLTVDFRAERELRLRFEVGLKVYNALLGEALRRIRRVRGDCYGRLDWRRSQRRNECGDGASSIRIRAGSHARRMVAALTVETMRERSCMAILRRMSSSQRRDGANC